MTEEKRSRLLGMIMGTVSKANLAEVIIGDASGLQYAFDPSTLRLDVTDTGVEGDSFVLEGSTLTIDEFKNALVVVREHTYDSTEYYIDTNNAVALSTSYIEADYATMKYLYDIGEVVTVEINGDVYELEVAKYVGDVIYDIRYYIGDRSTYKPLCLEQLAEGYANFTTSMNCLVGGKVTIAAYVKNYVAPIRFTVWDSVYFAKSGITWAEWVDAGAASDFSIDSSGFVMYESMPDTVYDYVYHYDSSGAYVRVKGSDTILDGCAYYW